MALPLPGRQPAWGRGAAWPLLHGDIEIGKGDNHIPRFGFAACVIFSFPQIWMWCLDSSVGRKVVLVWTLVSCLIHIGPFPILFPIHTGDVHWAGTEGHN